MNVYYIGDMSVSDELYHHGILGQKWGVRRFQNLDGTLTPAGKKRYYGITESTDTGGHGGSSRVHYKASGSTKEGSYTNKELNKLYKESKDMNEFQNKLDFSKVDHGEKGSKSPAAWFATNIALDIVFLNPVGAALDIYRGAQYVDGKIRSAKYKKEREGLETDPKTGFKKKNKDYSPEEDLKRVNPDLNDFNTNSKNNCMLCTMTYEMRRRGYDVTAKKSGNGYFDNEIKRWMPDAKIERFGGAKWNRKEVLKNLSGRTNKDFARNVVSQIENKQPNGARGNLTVMFDGGGGHSMFYEIVNGRMIIRDGQISKTFTDPVKVLAKCSDINVCRFDNLEFDPKTIKECCSS